jgi:hypothetical protein
VRSWAKDGGVVGMSARTSRPRVLTCGAGSGGVMGATSPSAPRARAQACAHEIRPEIIGSSVGTRPVHSL